MSKRELKLVQTKDWDQWISQVRTKATGYRIWDLINPSKDSRPTSRTEPLEPVYTPPLVTTIDTIAKAEADHKMAKKDYHTAYLKWNQEQESFVKIIDFIYDTVSASNIAFLQHCEVHPWDLLRTLQKRLAPTDSARSLELERLYKKLSAGPTQNQSVMAWIDEYCQMYPLAKHIGVAEVTDGKRALRDFIIAISKFNPVLAQFAERDLDKIKPGGHEDYQTELTEEFRNYLRMHKVENDHPAAFAASEAKDKDSDKDKPKGKTSLKDKDAKAPKCICLKLHWYYDCFYLNENHPKKPANWKPDPEMLKQIQDKLANDPEFKTKVERSIKRAQQIETRRNNNKENKKDEKKDEAGGAMTMAVFKGTFNVDNSLLRTTWILDGGSAMNICNSTMAHRFIQERECTDGSYVVAGGGPMPIKAYGRVKIIVSTPEGNKDLIVTNVSYVPNFMTNLVSSTHLQNKGNVYQDAENRRLQRGGKTFFTYTERFGLFLLEDNTDGHSDIAPSSFIAAKSGTTKEWHQLLAHAANDAIQHLPQAAEGVKITDKDKVPATNECQTCAVSKAHQIISRSTFKQEDSEEPFHRITYDLIPMTSALNKHAWISHVACAKTDFHLTDTHRLKSEAVKHYARLFASSKYATKAR